MAGLRWRPNSQVLLAVLAGGGGQYETQDSSTAGGSTTYSLNSQQNVSVQGQGRLLLRWRIVPGWIGIRLRGDGNIFTITQDVSGATIATNGMLTAAPVSTQQEQQLELHGRFFLDADVISFARFVPSIWGGVDYVSLTGATSSSYSAVPVVGIGVIRASL